MVPTMVSKPLYLYMQWQPTQFLASNHPSIPTATLWTACTSIAGQITNHFLLVSLSKKCWSGANNGVKTIEAVSAIIENTLVYPKASIQTYSNSVTSICHNPILCIQEISVFLLYQQWHQYQCTSTWHDKPAQLLALYQLSRCTTE